MKHCYQLRDAELAVLCGSADRAVDGHVSRIVNDDHAPRTVVAARLVMDEVLPKNDQAKRS